MVVLLYIHVCGYSYVQVPQFILDDFIERGIGSQCHIICTQPRRISAVSVSETRLTEGLYFVCLNECICVCVHVHLCVCVRERECVCVCVCERESVYMHACVCLSV